ncbi:MAG: glycosyltransferase family 4 protein, partial [Chloroflexi bacterium]
KDDFLGNAAALLFPISWPEPFGLVMPEALACGTPVLALRAGSVPEIITDGVTGFIRDTEDELVEAVARIREIDRARCRAEVERRYTARVMTDNYLNVYERLSAQQVAKEPASIA